MRLNGSTSSSNYLSSQHQGGTPLTLVAKSSYSTAEVSRKTSFFSRALAFKVAPNLLSSFRYAGQGVRYAFVTQRNFRIHTLIGSIAISLGLFLQVSAIKLSIIGVTIALVLVLELLNTALESVVDLTAQQQYHELAKITKDCAAGAVLVAAMAAVFVAGLILLPPLMVLLFA